MPVTRRLTEGRSKGTALAGPRAGPVAWGVALRVGGRTFQAQNAGDLGRWPEGDGGTAYRRPSCGFVPRRLGDHHHYGVVEPLVSLFIFQRLGLAKIRRRLGDKSPFAELRGIARWRRNGMCTEAILPPSRNRPPGMTATTLCVPEMGPVFGAVAPRVQTAACIVANAGGGERPSATEAQCLSVRPTFAFSVCCGNSHQFR